MEAEAIPAEVWTYFYDVYARLAQAVVPARKEVRFADGSPPLRAQCHENVDRWVEENPGWQAVRGWLMDGDGGNGRYLFVAHSLACGNDALLVDITPMPNRALRFVPHLGSEAEYAARRQPQIWLPLRC